MRIGSCRERHRRTRRGSRIVIPRSEATWESRSTRPHRGKAIGKIATACPRLPRAQSALAMTNLVASAVGGVHRNLQLPMALTERRYRRNRLVRFYRQPVRIGSAFPRLPRAQSALAMTNLLALRHRIRAAKPTACKALNPRKGDAASVRRQSRQRLRSEHRYRCNRLVRFIGTLYEPEVPSRDCPGRKAPSQ